MTTPTRAEIEKRARELYAQDCYRNGCSELAETNAEYSELLESGYIASAKSELMRDQTKAPISEWKNYNENFVTSETFNVDISELFNSGALILGSKHTGKSDVGMLICDKAIDKNAVVVVFDPSLDWITRSSINQYVKVENAISEIPQSSIIYDISLCSPNQAQKIVENFAEKLFEHQAQTQNRKQYLVIFEEAHTYFYQNCMRSKNAVNSARMLSVGRNVEIACLLISQFASMIDKFCLKHTISQAYFGFTREPNDISYLKQILGKQVNELPKLCDGELLFLNRNSLSKIRIGPYESHTEKTQIAIPEIQLAPIEPLKPKQNGVFALLNFAVVLLFAIAVLNSLR